MHLSIQDLYSELENLAFENRDRKYRNPLVDKGQSVSPILISVVDDRRKEVGKNSQRSKNS